MARRSASGVRHLIKHHNCGATSTADPTKCDCGWSGKYGGEDVVLSKWARISIDPRTKGKAILVLNRLKTAVDNGTFDAAGERAVQGTDETLAQFIIEWTTHYANERQLSANSMPAMLGVISDSRLGSMSLKRLAAATEDIEKWLNAEGKARQWKAKTWNGYHELLGRVLRQAIIWKRLKTDPMIGIARRVAVEPDHFKQRHLIEDVEDVLFAKVGDLNRPLPRSTRGKLTQAKADQIRAALAAGQLGKAVAARFKVSPAVVSAIKLGDIWNPERQQVMGTKGDEMRRRLIGAFDGGLRAGEMQKIQLSHVIWRLVTFDKPDGTRGQGYEIALPPEITKGGKSTGRTQTVFAGTPRFVQMLEQRRFQLKNNKPSRQFIFGTEGGAYQAGFRRLWRDLFTLAGLQWGRAYGLVWHTTRHEFISRIAERTDDTVLTKELARHQSLKTTEGYMHTRKQRHYAAAAGLAR